MVVRWIIAVSRVMNEYWAVFGRGQHATLSPQSIDRSNRIINKNKPGADRRHDIYSLAYAIVLNRT